MWPILTASCIYLGPRDDLERTEHLEESPHHREHGSSLAAPLIQSRTFTQSLQPITGQFSCHKQRLPFRNIYKVHRSSVILIPIRNFHTVNRTNTGTLSSNRRYPIRNLLLVITANHRHSFMRLLTSSFQQILGTLSSPNQRHPIDNFHTLITTNHRPSFMRLLFSAFQLIFCPLSCQNQRHPIGNFHKAITTNHRPPFQFPRSQPVRNFHIVRLTNHRPSFMPQLAPSN